MPSNRQPLSKELKRALKKLPTREKDRLLLRLLPTNPDLVRKLEFKLLEDSATQERRAALDETIAAQAREFVHRYASPTYLLRDYRTVSTEITRHRKATRDKLGEVELTLLLFNSTLPELVEELSAPIPDLGKTLHKYVIQRTVKLLKLLTVLSPEERLTQQPALIELGEVMSEIPNLREAASRLNFDINWLLSGEWPTEL